MRTRVAPLSLFAFQSSECVWGFIPTGVTTSQRSFVTFFDGHHNQISPFVSRGWTQLLMSSSQGEQKVVSSSSSSPEIKAFIDWLVNDHGCEGIEDVLELRGDISPASLAPRGVFMKDDEPFEPEDYICAIPFSASLTFISGEESWDSNDAEEGLMYWRTISLLAQEGKLDAWEPFLDVLPTDDTSLFDPTPDFWADEDICQLEYPPLVRAAQQRKQHIRDLASTMESQGVHIEPLQFATWLVKSRGFTIASQSEAPTTPAENGEMMVGASTTSVMIPFLDMVNHSTQHSNCHLRIFAIPDKPEESYYALQATRKIEKGDELLLSYGTGTESSSDLFLNYGFVQTEENPNDVKELTRLADDDSNLFEWSTTLQEDMTKLQETEDGSTMHKILSFRVKIKKAQQQMKLKP